MSVCSYHWWVHVSGFMSLVGSCQWVHIISGDVSGMSVGSCHWWVHKWVCSGFIRGFMSLVGSYHEWVRVIGFMSLSGFIMSVGSCQWVHVRGFMSVGSCQWVHVSGFMSSGFMSVGSVGSCQWVQWVHVSGFMSLVGSYHEWVRVSGFMSSCSEEGQLGERGCERDNNLAWTV